MLYISPVIVAEIRLDIERVAEGTAHRKQRSAHVERAADLERGVLPVSEGTMLHRRSPTEEGRRTRHYISQADLIIAATALEYGPAIVSIVTSVYEKVRVLAAIARAATARL